MPQRIAIVTGAARGIGAGTAKRLASDGLAVAVLDLSEASGADTVAEIEKAGGKAIAVGADVSDADQVQAAVDKVVADLGEPTVLINNAGVTRDNLIFKMSENDWDTVMNVHLRGAFLMTRATQKYMVAAKWGRIVNLSSTSAVGNQPTPCQRLCECAKRPPGEPGGRSATCVDSALSRCLGQPAWPIPLEAWLNFSLTLPPRAATTPITRMAMRARMRMYSTIVAPRSVLAKRALSHVLKT